MSFGHERLDVYRAAIQYVVGIDPDADSDSDPETDRGRTSRCSRRGAERTTGSVERRAARLNAGSQAA